VIDSSDSSLPATPSRSTEANASPRTPTGRLQPNSAFRQWSSSAAEPETAERQSTPDPDVIATPALPEVSHPEPTELVSAVPAASAAGSELRSEDLEPEVPRQSRSRSTGRSGVDRKSAKRSSSGHSRVPGSTRGPRRTSSTYAELAAIDLESAAVAGSSLRELSGLLLAFGLSLVLTQASLWWLVGIDPVGLAPFFSPWLPSIVPPGLRP